MWQGTNLNKRDITLDLTSDRGPRPRPSAGPRSRRRRGELLAAGDRAVRAGLRVARGAEARRDSRAHARVRPTGAVARLRRLGAELRADLGHVGGHRLCRRSAVQPAGTRRPDRRGARRGRTARRARAPAPHRRRPTRRDRPDRGRGMRRRRAGDRVLDERRCAAARGQPQAGLLQGVYPTAADGEWVAISRARRRRLGAIWSRRWGDPTCSSRTLRGTTAKPRTTSSTPWLPTGREP